MLQYCCYDLYIASANSFMRMASNSVGIDNIKFAMPNSQGDVVDLFGTQFDKAQRSANCTVDEDDALVMAWESVTLDAVTGNNQTGTNYWKHIDEQFHHNVKTRSYRQLKSLIYHWCLTQESLNRWVV